MIIETFTPCTHSNRLNSVVSLFTHKASFNQSIHHTLSKDNFFSAVDISQHLFWEDNDILQDAFEAVEHIVEQHSCIRQDNTFSSRVRNITFVPQSHVFSKCSHITTHHASATTNIFRRNRVTFMRHSRRTFLTLTKCLFHFMHLSALQVTDFESHLFERRSNHRQSSHIVSMTVALQYLSRNQRMIDAKVFAHILFDERRNISKVTNRTTHLTTFNIGSSTFKTLNITFHFSIPQHPFQTKRSDVGMDTVSTTNARLRFEADCLFTQHFEEFTQIFAQNIISLFNQITIRSINHVSRCQTIVHPFTLLTQSFTHRTRKRHNIMTSLLLNLIDTRN